MRKNKICVDQPYLKDPTHLFMSCQWKKELWRKVTGGWVLVAQAKSRKVYNGSTNDTGPRSRSRLWQGSYGIVIYSILHNKN